MCSTAWGRLGLWSHVKERVCKFKLPNQACCLLLHRAFRFPVYCEETVTLYFFPLLLALSPMNTSHISQYWGHSWSEYETINSAHILFVTNGILKFPFWPRVLQTVLSHYMGSLYQHFYSAGLWLYFLAKQVSHLAQRDITLTQHGQRGSVHYPAHQYKFLPLGLRSPEQQGEPGVALIIFMAFIVSGVVPSLVSRHRWLNTHLPGWQSTRHTHPRSQNHVHIAAYPPEDATDDMFTFDCCCSILVVVLIVAVVLSLEEDILLSCYYGSHLLVLKTAHCLNVSHFLLYLEITMYA